MSACSVCVCVCVCVCVVCCVRQRERERGREGGRRGLLATRSEDADNDDTLVDGRVSTPHLLPLLLPAPLPARPPCADASRPDTLSAFLPPRVELTIPSLSRRAAATATATATAGAFAHDDLFGFMDADQQAQFAANDDDEGGDNEKVRTRTGASALPTETFSDMCEAVYLSAAALQFQRKKDLKIYLIDAHAAMQSVRPFLPASGRHCGHH